MKYETAQLLRAVRTEGEDWHGVKEQLDSGRNFFVILPGDPGAIKRFCQGFELESDCVNDTFNRSDLLRMGQYVDSAAFDEMLTAWESNEQVIFLEQLDFPINQPPHVKPFLVYSPVWGILSQHDELSAAKHGLEEAEDWQERSRLAQPVIYRWEKGWKMV
jgi:hypothetical protein